MGAGTEALGVTSTTGATGSGAGASATGSGAGTGAAVSAAASSVALAATFFFVVRLGFGSATSGVLSTSAGSAAAATFLRVVVFLAVVFTVVEAAFFVGFFFSGSSETVAAFRGMFLKLDGSCGWGGRLDGRDFIKLLADQPPIFTKSSSEMSASAWTSWTPSLSSSALGPRKNWTTAASPATGTVFSDR